MRLFIFYFVFTSFLISQEKISELHTREWVDSVYNSLSLEEKVGQLFVNWVSPEQSDYNQIEKLVVEQKIGGLIFSIGNPFTHIEWMNKYQSKAKTPLLIAMDAEWGPAMRLDDVFAYPWNMTLGAIQDNKIVKDISKRIAQQNKLLGIHYNFSPVVDVNSNPMNPIIGNRSFGEDPENVYQKAKAYIEGHDEVGIITSLKHFPGHGDTSNDSHKTLPEIKSNLKRLNEVELYPFKKLIDDNIVSSIMAAHILYPSLDKKYPSSISKKIVKNLLKEKLGFEGLIVTDALDMQGVLQDPKISVDLRAFLVGNDILLMSTDVAKGIKSISNAYKKGQISENRLSSSVKKILQAKATVNLNKYSPLSSEFILDKLNTVKDTLLYSKAMESATTLVKNKDDIIQLDPHKKYLHVSFGESGKYFYNQLNKTHKIDKYDKQTYESLFKKVDYDGLIITYQGSNTSPYNSYKIPENIVDIINKISLNNNVILNLFLNPYSLNSFSSIDNIES
ncbi:MAG: beta-N-acetylglucosaminidase, partial [Pelagibacterales bacterium]|nr:beta-N-acetylglucosaminidase [Pelagibacterales bacterium]